MSVLYLVNLATIFTSDPMALLAHGTLQFLVPDLWPHSNPGVNPVDYKVGGVIQERVYRTPMLDVADLKRRLIAAWSGLHQHGETIDCLRACVRTVGRHFQHLI